MSETSDKSRYQKPTPMVPYIPEGQSELTHLCGCKEYEEDDIWYLKQCGKHKTETDGLIERLRKRMQCTT